MDARRLRTAAVIAEFNPFHRGHAYLLRRCRELGADCVLAVMSGNYVQRGGPAVFDRALRTKAALLCGADLVVELPLPFAMATAERFAYGAVSLLKGLGMDQRDLLVFGSEAGSMEALTLAAGHCAAAEASPLFRRFLEEGDSFASARQRAVEALCPASGELLRQPNNALGVEYLRKLEQLECPMVPYTLPRRGADHHSDTPREGFASASLLRRGVLEGRWEEIAGFFPRQAAEVFREGLSQAAVPELGERAVLCRLRTLERESLSRLPDCSEGIENRLWKSIRQACTFGQLCDMMKTKRYPMARVRRLVYSAFLQLDGELCRQAVPYCRPLGFTRRGEALLARWKGEASIPVAHSLKRLEESGELCRRFAQAEAAADDLYSLFQPSPRPCGAAYTSPVLRIDPTGYEKMEE